MENYKINYLLHELKKTFNEVSQLEDYILVLLDNSYVFIKVQDSHKGYVENQKQEFLILNDLVEVYNKMKTCNDINKKRKCDNVNTSNVEIYLIIINFNSYTTGKKKRYPNVFKMVKTSIKINNSEWLWRYNYLVNVINNINNTSNKYTKLFYRNFLSDKNMI